MGFFGRFFFFFNSFPAGGPLLQQWDEREREKEENGKIRALKGKIEGHREVTCSLLSKARLAFQGTAVFKEIGFQLHVCHKLLLRGPGHRLRLLYLFWKRCQRRLRKVMFIQAVFGDPGGLLYFLIVYFPGC